MPELPEVEALRRSLDDPVRGISDRAGRAGAHRDAEDVRPAAGGAGGPAARRRRAARQAAALPDRGRRARAARAPDVRRAAALPARGRGRARRSRRSGSVRGRRPARPDRGRREEARRRVAADARAGRGGARAPRPGGARARRGAARRDPGGRAPAAALAPARPAADRGDRPRLGERDPAHAQAVAFRAHGPGSDPGRGRPLAEAIDSELSRGLELRERGAKDASVYRVHKKLDEPCHVCGTPIEQVDFEQHTIYYCPQCQTSGRLLKDRRCRACFGSAAPAVSQS